MIKGIYKFCNEHSNLLESHIISKFAFKNISLLENNKIDIRKKCTEQLAQAFSVHPAIIMFPEYEADLIHKAA